MDDSDAGSVPAGAQAGRQSHAASEAGHGRGGRESLAGSPVSGQAGASEQPRKSRRRRKRKRGRKVFAQDAAQRGGVSGEKPPRPAASPARVTSPAGDARPAPQGRNAEAARRPAAGRKYRPGPLPVYAALDLGTNNCRLLIAVPGKPGEFRVIDAFSRIVRLGEGLGASGRLADAAMTRAVEALRICADKLAAREISRARLIATEACRAAANGAEFLARVAEQTGLELEIIDRETEARLAVSGCGPLVEAKTQAVVLFDIGGGSSEIALVDVSGARRPRLANHIVAWTSLPVGVVSLAERFGGRNVTREIFSAMVEEVSGMIDAFAERGRLGALVGSPGFHLLGTSGTVTTLAGVHLGLERYDRRRVDGLWMQGGEIDSMVEKLLGWEFHQRVANPCIGNDRADLVLAGCAILQAIRRVWPSERLRVADRGLREGILSELMGEDGAWRRSGHRAGARP